VRFLTRRSPCNPKAIIYPSFPKKVITTIEVTSNASSVFDKTWYARKAKGTNFLRARHPLFVASKQRPQTKKEANPKCEGLKQEGPPTKREATPKHKGLKKERPPTKREATPKCKGLSVKNPWQKMSIKKANSANLTLKCEGDTFHFKL
jgi:hypothetical protein